MLLQVFLLRYKPGVEMFSMKDISFTILSQGDLMISFASPIILFGSNVNDCKLLCFSFKYLKLFLYICCVARLLFSSSCDIQYMEKWRSTQDGITSLDICCRNLIMKRYKISRIKLNVPLNINTSFRVVMCSKLFIKNLFTGGNN